jgi:hypothetical protein
VHSVQITFPVQSLALWLSAQEQTNVRDWRRLIKKKKPLVDVAPHWGEPRKYCVDGLLCVIMLMLWIFLVQ